MTDGSLQHPSRGPLDRARLEAELAEDPDLTLELLATAPSTNQVAADRARDGAAEGLVVVADHQVAGRGRLDRTWESPAGTAVTFSLVLRPTVAPAAWPWLPLLVGHTLAKTLTALGHPAGVKWPNDVLLADDAKVAGILVERIETSTGPVAIVGVGINVDLGADELPVPTATSLALSGGPLVEREQVLLEVVRAVHEGYDVWQAGGDLAAQRLAASYREHCVTLGRDVRVDLPGGGVLLGRAVDIDEHGRLVVEGPDGAERVGAGDVVHVRASA